jgi:hypothetical protein
MALLAATRRTSLCALILAVSACKTSEFTGSSKREAEAPPPQSKTFTQISRETRKVTVNQGYKGASSNESYAVTAKGVLDVLVVVDNSGSMGEEQAGLAGRLTPLLSAVKDSDWQIAVTTTDPSDRCVTSLIQKNDWFVETRFKSAINAGVDGTGTERPFLRAVEGLKSDCLFGPGKWVRPDSTLAVLIVTDEDSCYVGSGGQGYANCSDQEPGYLLNYISSIKKLGTQARVYGLIWGPQTSCSTALKSADKVAQAITQSGGTYGSICDSDYSGTLTRISSDVAKILTADFSLKSVPDAGSLKITVGGQNWTDFTLNGKVVHFTKAPPQNAPIQVSYMSGANGVVTNSFALPSEPADGSIQATINGQSAGAVSWNAQNKQAVFATQPPEKSAIEISYKENTPLQATFEIAKGVNGAEVSATVNDAPVAADGFTYDAALGQVKFKTPPAEGAKIVITWQGAQKSG